MMPIRFWPSFRRVWLFAGLAVASLAIVTAAWPAALAAAAAPAAVDPLPAEFADNQIAAPAILMEVALQALEGPQHELLTIDYAAAVSASRTAKSALAPRFSTNWQLAGAAPFTDTKDAGVLAGPGLNFTWPVGQGQMNAQFGLAGSLATGNTGSSAPVTGLVPQTSLNWNVPLFAGPDLRRSQADQNMTAARASYNRQRNQLILAAARAYYAVLWAADDLQVARLTRALAQAEYDRAVDQSAQGTLSRVELSNLRAALVKATDAELATERTLAAQRDRLQTLLGVGADSPLLQPPPAAAAPAERVWHASTNALPADIAGWISLAEEMREDIQVAESEVTLAEAAAAKARATVGRNISFTAAVTWPRELTEDEQDMRTEVRVGIGGTYYLHDTARRESITTADLALAKAEQLRQAKYLAVEQEIKQACYDVTAAGRALRQASEQLDQENMLLATAQHRLEQGLSIQLDVQAQELAVAQQTARLRRLQAELILARLALWHTAGLQVNELSI